jgi:hypothetical protein
LSWSESGEGVIFGPDIVTEAEEKVKQIQANILAAQSHEKSYADKRCSPLEFEVGDHVYLWVSPMKGVRCFGIKGKLAPRYIGPYPIIDKYGLSSYDVGLPVMLSGVHNVFHVSQLKRCLKPLTDVVIRHHPIGTRFDVQGTSHQGSRPTSLGHTKQDYAVLQDPME